MNINFNNEKSQTYLRRNGKQFNNEKIEADEERVREIAIKLSSWKPNGERELTVRNLNEERKHKNCTIL
ncbi:putative E3 ubiquitin-protein ligase [Sesbania bispinosa]|nr:putative E3 ubiquitin-protein ligase [Sesbania bispinosa]